MADDGAECEGNGSSCGAANVTAPLWMWKYLAYWDLIVLIIGAPMNAFVIFIWATLSSRSANRRFSSSQSKNRWFILSMTCGDFIFSVFHTSLSYAWFGTVIEEMTDGPCYLMYGATHLSTTVSSVSLLLLNVDKFIYLHWPLHYHSRMTTRRALGLTLGAWLVSLTWMLLFLFSPFLSRQPSCSWVAQYHEFYLIFLILFFLLPIILSTATSLYIATVAVRTSISEAAMQAAYQPSVSSNYLSTDAAEEKVGQLNGRASTSSTMSTVKPWRTITFVFTTTIWFTLTVLPYRISYVVTTMTGKSDISWSLPLLALMVLYAAGNPFITIFTQPPYRKRAFDVVTGVKNRLLCVRGDDKS